MKAFFAAILLIFVGGQTEGSVMTSLVNSMVSANKGKMANVTIDKIDLGDKGTCTDVVIRGLDQIALTKMETESMFSPNFRNLTMTCSSLTFTGNCIFSNLALNEYNINVTLNGVGTVSGEAAGITISTGIKDRLMGTTIQITDLYNFYAHCGGISFCLTGFDSCPEINTILNREATTWLNTNYQPLFFQYKPQMISSLNDQLAKMT